MLCFLLFNFFSYYQNAVVVLRACLALDRCDELVGENMPQLNDLSISKSPLTMCLLFYFVVIFLDLCCFLK